eukprot:401728_1
MQAILETNAYSLVSRISGRTRYVHHDPTDIRAHQLECYYHRMDYDLTQNTTSSDENEDEDAKQQQPSDIDMKDESGLDSDDLMDLLNIYPPSQTTPTAAVQTINIPNICKLCDRNEIEDIQHFMMKCDQFEEQRRILRSDLCSIYTRFSLNRTFQVKNLLYPYRNQRMTHFNQKKVWHGVLKYVRSTKRLKYKLIKTSDHALTQTNRNQNQNQNQNNNSSQARSNIQITQQINFPWNPG